MSTAKMAPYPITNGRSGMPPVSRSSCHSRSAYSSRVRFTQATTVSIVLAALMRKARYRAADALGSAASRSGRAR